MEHTKLLTDEDRRNLMNCGAPGVRNLCMAFETLEMAVKELNEKIDGIYVRIHSINERVSGRKNNN